MTPTGYVGAATIHWKCRECWGRAGLSCRASCQSCGTAY